MANDDGKRRIGQSVHQITLQGRTKLSISGVEEVESFDESAISRSTQDGYLMIRGSDLHIEKLNLEGGELCVEGTVDSMSYEDQTARSVGLFSRLFRA